MRHGFQAHLQTEYLSSDMYQVTDTGIRTPPLSSDHRERWQSLQRSAIHRSQPQVLAVEKGLDSDFQRSRSIQGGYRW